MSHNNEKEALQFHRKGRAGKTEIIPTKPSNSSEEIALAYSPGAHFPSGCISKEKWNAYRYTNKGNLIGLLSDGTDSMASKPLMEGKSMLMKTFADIDAFDIEINNSSESALIKTIQSIAPTFGALSIGGIRSCNGLNLQKELQQRLDIPVFHDEAYGTAIVITAAVINHLKHIKKDASEIRTVFIGNNETTQATMDFLREEGFEHTHTLTAQCAEITENGLNGYELIICTDREYTPAPGNFMNVAANAAIILLSPYIDYEGIKKNSPASSLFTGNIKMPNYIDSILVSPYIFRAALDTLATKINKEMIKAAIKSIAMAAETEDKNTGALLPTYKSNRLATEVTEAVARAAIDSGISRRNILNWREYRHTLLSRLERIYNMTQHIRYYNKNNSRLHRRYMRAAPEF